MSFVDTNVLVHATAPSSPEYRRAEAALDKLAKSEHIAISRQILREYLAVVTRKQTWAEARSMAEALRAAATFTRLFDMLEDGPSVWGELERLSRLALFGGKQVHDANIVATMLAHGERRLLTFDAAHFRPFDSLIELIEP